jgi:lipopolysaccharide/colanic/teichoic acid biosynthesis glycosyltransferase
MYKRAKRILDFVGAVTALVLLAPLMIAIGLLVKLDSSGPIFHGGVRVGLGAKPFRMLKFRTMVPDAERLGGTSTPEDDPRLTRGGRLMRAYKIDELPQLLNVLRGQMSFVGPRPQVPWAVDLYTPEEREVLTVRPGLTDLASLRFADEGEILRGSLDPDRDYMLKIHPEKMRLGLEYVRRQSFALDVQIVLLTIATVLKIRRPQ